MKIELIEDEWCNKLIKFPSGATRPAFEGAIGIREDEGEIDFGYRICTGWDETITLKYSNAPEQNVTKEDLIALIDFQIERWEQFKENVENGTL